mmetsp:Transcript_27857/g.24650  ORF Transcript_27857/g.24650 Transcript_27857/m.24650 type:complete len:186 (+) Transcript_27857:26-583(+)
MIQPRRKYKPPQHKYAKHMYFDSEQNPAKWNLITNAILNENSPFHQILIPDKAKVQFRKKINEINMGKSFKQNSDLSRKMKNSFRVKHKSKRLISHTPKNSELTNINLFRSSASSLRTPKQSFSIRQLNSPIESIKESPFVQYIPKKVQKIRFSARRISRPPLFASSISKNQKEKSDKSDSRNIL